CKKPIRLRKPTPLVSPSSVSFSVSLLVSFMFPPCDMRNVGAARDHVGEGERRARVRGSRSESNDGSQSRKNPYRKLLQESGEVIIQEKPYALAEAALVVVEWRRAPRPVQGR